MDIAFQAVLLWLIVRGGVATYRDIARATRRMAGAIRATVGRAARAVAENWRRWRSYRHRMAVRRREGRERLMIESQRELVSVIASMREEIAVLRERLERKPGDEIGVATQRIRGLAS